MTETERISFLIKHLAGGNASNFAKKIGVEKGNLSKVVCGRQSARLVIPKILEAFPQVNRQWLEEDEGYPGDISVELVKAHYEAKLQRCDMIIDHLTRRIDDLEGKIPKK